MDTVATDFATQFYNLQGDTLASRKENFFRFLRQSDFLKDKQQVHDALDKLQPRNYMERLFKVDALIYFKRIDMLFDLLQNGTNEVYVAKIIKQKWVFEEIFGSFTVEKFVNEFLPQTSFTLRMKLLDRVSSIWNEDKVNELYDSLLKRYGIFIAKTILDKCSAKKLESALAEFRIELNANQVIRLFNKDVDMFKMYVVYHSRQYGRYGEQKVFDRVALRNPELLLEFQKQKIINYKMGRKISKKAFELIKDDVGSAEYYFEFMHKSVLIRKWGNEFQNVHKQMFPKEIKEINIYKKYFQFLKFYPKNKRWPLFLNAFSENFGLENISKCYIDLKENFIRICHPSKGDIQKWAMYNYLEKGSVEFLKYYEAPKAISILKEKINVTSDISSRERLLELMIEVCNQNEDLNAFDEVLKYICVRHRNEDYYIRQHILNKIFYSFKCDFRLSHWQFINEQIKILRVQKKHDICSCRYLNESYISFLFENDAPFEDPLVQYIKDAVSLKYTFHLNLQKPEIVSRFYKETVKLFPKAVQEINEDCDSYFIKLIIRVIEFGKDNPDYIIKLEEFPNIVDFIVNIFAKTDKLKDIERDFIASILMYNIKYPSSSIDQDRLLQIVTNISLHAGNEFSMGILKKNRNDFENKLLKTYFESIFDDYPIESIVSWLLINEPSVVVPYFDKIIGSKLSRNHVNDKSVVAMKYCPQFDFDQKFRSFYQNLLNDHNLTDDEIVIGMKRLTLLLTTDEFVKIVEEYFTPKKDKLDLEDETMLNLYNSQCDIIKTLHKVEEPSKLLPVIMKFCVGDYLKSALPALYSVFYRSPEQQLHPYVKSLSKRAVSVKKHSLFLSCQVLDCITITKMFAEANSSKVSTQKHISSSLFRYFMKSPSQGLFDLVIKNLFTVDKNDTETLDYLKDARVPKKYEVLYFEKCWEFYESLEKKGVKIVTYLNSLLHHILESDEVIECLSTDFVDKILNQYFKRHVEDLCNIELFVFGILKKRSSEQTKNLKMVFEILKQFNIQQIYNFVGEFDSAHREDTDKNFVEVFMEHWKTYFKITDTFRESISLQLLLFYHSSENSQIYAQRIVDYMEQLVNAYGPHCPTLFANVLHKHLQSVTDKEKVFNLLLNILYYKNNVDTCVLVLTTMDKYVNKECEKVFNEIKMILGNCPDDIVKILFHQFYLQDVQFC